jgi:predicted phage tail protein
MRLIEIAVGVILLGGAAWTTVRTYKGRAISSILFLAFAVFLVTLGLAFLFGAFGELLRTSGSGASGSNEPDTKGKSTSDVVNYDNHCIAR